MNIKSTYLPSVKQKASDGISHTKKNYFIDYKFKTTKPKFMSYSSKAYTIFKGLRHRN